MRSSIFPDVNVWLAATHQQHVHHQAAVEWIRSQSGCEFYFCRVTQLSFLRLLTNEKVMGDEVLSQQGAWNAYSRWMNQLPVRFSAEPDPVELDRFFQKLTTQSRRSRSSPKLWADAYLASFAKCTGFVLVTFDKALAKLASPHAELISVPSA